MAKRSRCLECRKRFTPAATTAHRQKTCGLTCRLARQRRQARARRSRDPAGYRAAERARQEVHRDRQREEASGCHAPASAPIPAELQDKVQQIVDKAARVSRAGFDRGVREILRELGEIWADAGRCHAPTSHPKPP